MHLFSYKLIFLCKIGFSLWKWHLYIIILNVLISKHFPIFKENIASTLHHYQWAPLRWLRTQSKLWWCKGCDGAIRPLRTSCQDSLPVQSNRCKATLSTRFRSLRFYLTQKCWYQIYVVHYFSINDLIFKRDYCCHRKIVDGTCGLVVGRPDASKNIGGLNLAGNWELVYFATPFNKYNLI